MKESLKTIYNQFHENYVVIGKSLKMESYALFPLCTYHFAINGVTPDPARMEECRKILKKHVNIFSAFRYSLNPVSICMLAADESPEQLMETAAESYHCLNKCFYESIHLTLAALRPEIFGAGECLAERAERGKLIYNELKNRHFWLLDSQDAMFSIILSDRVEALDQMMDECEMVLKELKPVFSSNYSNYIQTVSFIFQMSGQPIEELLARYKKLIVAVKANGITYFRGLELPSLAALCLLDMDFDTMVTDLFDVFNALSALKEYQGILPMFPEGVRLVHASMLVFLDHPHTPAQDLAVQSSTISYFEYLRSNNT